eukprot:374333-Amphidinium_carterae.1
MMGQLDRVTRWSGFDGKPSKLPLATGYSEWLRIMQSESVVSPQVASACKLCLSCSSILPRRLLYKISA